MLRKHSHYFKDVSKLETVDVYCLIELFDVTHPCLQHAIKKLLVAGGRGAKNVETDIQEAIDTLVRYLEMRQEDAEIDLVDEIPGRLASYGIVPPQTVPCMHVFGSEPCGYTGDRRGNHCDGSIQRCRELGCSKNYGGFPKIG